MLAPRTILVFALVVAVIGYGDEARAQSCAEFSKRVTERTVGEHQGTQDLIVTGDFDGNGEPDRAFFAEIDGRIPLVVCLHGRRRALWLSASDKLLEDARRDWAAIGGSEADLIPLGKFRQGAEVPQEAGILFATYATLRSPARQGKSSRLEQIVGWLADGMDEASRHAYGGVIVFDEAHAMANAAGSKGSRGIRPRRSRDAPDCVCRTPPINTRLLKIGARVVERAARIRIHFASACPDAALFRLLAGRLAASGP